MAKNKLQNGDRVKIIRGEFEGQKGTVYRTDIRGKMCYVDLDCFISGGIISSDDLEKIEDEKKIVQDVK